MLDHWWSGVGFLTTKKILRRSHWQVAKITISPPIFCGVQHSARVTTTLIPSISLDAYSLSTLEFMLKYLLRLIKYHSPWPQIKHWTVVYISIRFSPSLTPILTQYDSRLKWSQLVATHQYEFNFQLFCRFVSLMITVMIQSSQSDSNFSVASFAGLIYDWSEQG